jgi:hypothetical protein
MTVDREAVRKARLADAVKAVVDRAPPLTADQVARLRVLFGSASFTDAPLPIALLPERYAIAGVYFISDGGHIKIGHSGNVYKRLKSLQTASPRELRVVGILRSDDRATVEQQWHRRFAHLMTRGEWFQATPELISAIDQAGVVS